MKPVNPSVMLNTIMDAFDRQQDSEGTRTLSSEEPDEDILMEIKGARILLAEDNQINQQVAKEILINAGLRVSISNNG